MNTEADQFFIGFDMARLIIGHTTESSTVIWVRGDSRYPFAFVTIRGADVDRTQTVSLEERHFFTGTAEFRQLTANSEYQISVEFGEKRTSQQHQRVSFGHCDGQLRTFPADDSTQPFSFILGSCNLHSLGVLVNPDIAFENIAAQATSRDASFMIHCGDQIYYDIPNFLKRPDIDEYREKYLDAWSDSRRTRKFLTMLPQYMILDDHEITNNFANDMNAIASGASPQLFRDIATKAYREFQHIRHPQQFGNQALYYHFNVGRTQFFVLDTRTERFLGTGNSAAQIIGKEQMRAFLAWLKEHKDAVKMVVTSVPFVFEVRDSDDKWSSAIFKKQREEILEFLVANDIAGTVFLTGDMHCSGHAKMSVSKGDHSVDVHELMSSPINQLGKSSLNDFHQRLKRKSANGAFSYTSSFTKNEFFDEHSNAMAVTVSDRDISYEIFRTRKNKVAKKSKSFAV